jgi:putative nucleotidyltransferase with HDIG domain
MARQQGGFFRSRQKSDRIEKYTSMLVHIVADHPNKISDLRPLFGSQHLVTSALLDGKGRMPKECGAIIAAADLRNADSIAALKAVSAAFNSAQRRIFVVDQKARLDAAQAYALGATHVLFNPVYQRSLLAALAGTSKSHELSGDADRGARETASEGAACLASMFSAVSSGRQLDAADAKQAAGKISNVVGESGFSHWLETVRRHHEGTYQHCLLVTGTAAAFGLSLGLAKADMERLYSAAMFHDVGKAKIPSAVLDKPGRLDDQERALIETHPAAGYDALVGSGGISSEILDAVRHHHEYLDGSGYPDGLGAAHITDIVRVLTISDIFSALIEDRRYKPPMSRAQAYDILAGMRGKLEMPLVTAFKSVALNR